MTVFSYSHYRDFLKDRLLKLPHQGRGEPTKMAKHLGVHSTLISLILSGERELTLEQAFELTEFLQMTEIESEYFVLLVQVARAGSRRYQSFLKKKLATVREEATKLVHRFEHDSQLSDEQRSIFYSTWLYSAIRLFTSTSESGVSAEEVQKKFAISRTQSLAFLSFLLKSGLVTFDNERYKIGPQRTFLEQGSPHLLKHHSNWRVKAIQKSDHLTEEELMFTSPVSLSKADFIRLREEFANLLKVVSSTVKASPAEAVACINIDFFWVD